jgi:hypothetical protein
MSVYSDGNAPGEISGSLKWACKALISLPGEVGHEETPGEAQSSVLEEVDTGE